MAADIKGNGYRGARRKGCSVRMAGVCLSAGRSVAPRKLAGRTPFPDRDRRSPPWSRRPPSAGRRQSRPPPRFYKSAARFCLPVAYFVQDPVFPNAGAARYLCSVADSVLDYFRRLFTLDHRFAVVQSRLPTALLRRCEMFRERQIVAFISPSRSESLVLAPL